MLGDKKAVANVAVKDLDVATKFYTNTLGLTPVQTEEQDMVVFRSGASEIRTGTS
jgi:catechol-2,3-dioxygenase